MPKFRFVCQVNSVDGRDEEFQDWHTNVHMPEVLEAAGFTSGQRMKLVTPNPADDKPFQYLIIYEGECADPKHALDALWEAAGAGRLGSSDALAMPNWMAVFEDIPGAHVTR